MQLSHDHVFYADMVEALSWIRLVRSLTLGKEIHSVGEGLVRAVTCTQGEIA